MTCHQSRKEKKCLLVKLARQQGKSQNHLGTLAQVSLWFPTPMGTLNMPAIYLPY